MEITKDRALRRLRDIIEYYNLSRCKGIPGDIPIVEVPLDETDICALQIAIHSIASLSKLKEVLYDTSLCAEEKEDRLICMLSRPVVDLDLKKEDDPDAH